VSPAGAPLDGLVVVALEQAIAAPFATRQLADLGAVVIKVERPGGDLARHYDAAMGGQSVNFAWANRGKQSVVLDLRDPSDRLALSALIAGADVFIHNVAPATARDLGVVAAELVDLHPALVACEISGYGPGGPRSDDKAYDLAIQGEAGAFSVTGGPEMSKVGFSVADIAAAMYALSGILAALVRRERTGAGAAVSVSMLDALVEWMSAPLYAAVHGPGQASRTGRRHHSIAPYGTFELGDGSTLLIAVQRDEEWRRMARIVLDEPSLGDDERFATNADRIAHVDELERAIRERLKALPASVARERLKAARIATARINDLRGVWQHEQLRARGRFEQVDTPTGSVEMLTTPFDISGWHPGAGRVPGLGEHDEALLKRARTPPPAR
jgi:crotonobetainyl-CoA:carnitine CoA-transferase CaiB-like acyl-CoA transferase